MMLLVLEQSYLFLLVLECHLEPCEWVTRVQLISTLAEHSLDLLGTAAQVHQLVGEVHALFHKAEVLVLQSMRPSHLRAYVRLRYILICKGIKRLCRYRKLCFVVILYLQLSYFQNVDWRIFASGKPFRPIKSMFSCKFSSIYNKFFQEKHGHRPQIVSFC